VAADNNTGPCFEMEHPSSGYSSDVNEKLQARTDAILEAVGGDIAFDQLAEGMPSFEIVCVTGLVWCGR